MTGRAEDRGRNLVWDCACDCGATAQATTTGLRSGRRVSCGCARKTRTRKTTGFTPHHYYSVLRRGAEKRGLQVEITERDYLDITAKPCTFCGAEPGVENIGVDRIDPSEGYTLENCQSACWECNRAKHSRSNGEFGVWLERVAAHFS